MLIRVPKVLLELEYLHDHSLWHLFHLHILNSSRRIIIQSRQKHLQQMLLQTFLHGQLCSTIKPLQNLIHNIQEVVIQDICPLENLENDAQEDGTFGIVKGNVGFCAENGFDGDTNEHADRGAVFEETGTTVDHVVVKGV